jgi:transcription initiation factor TFIID subunit TAF12
VSAVAERNCPTRPAQFFHGNDMVKVSHIAAYMKKNRYRYRMKLSLRQHKNWIPINMYRYQDQGNQIRCPLRGDKVDCSIVHIVVPARQPNEA